MFEREKKKKDHYTLFIFINVPLQSDDLRLLDIIKLSMV